LIEDHSLEISKYLKYTGEIDYSRKDGRNYSDRLPGTAFLSIPFYYYGKLLRDSGHGTYVTNRSNIPEVFVVFLPNLAATLSVFLMFRLCIAVGFDFIVSLLTAILFAFTTLLWREGSHFFAHAQSIAALLGASYLAVTIESFSRDHQKHAFLIAALLAVAGLVEQVNVLHVFPFFTYAIASGKLNFTPAKKNESLALVVKAAFVYFSLYAILIVYNFLAFREITLRPAKYNPNFPEYSLANVLQGDPITGIDTLLTNFLTPERIFDWAAGAGNATPGVFVASPILILGLIGFYEFAKSRGSEIVLFASMISIQIGVVSLNHNPQTRHILVILPLLFFPLAYVLRHALSQIRRAGADTIERYGLIVLVIVAAAYSAARTFYSINTFYGRSLSSPFVFTAEIPAYFFFYLSIFGGYLFYRLISRKLIWLSGFGFQIESKKS